VALCAGVSAAVALGAPPPPPPPTSSTPPPTTSTPPPTSTSTPPPSSSTAPPPTSAASTPHHRKHHKKRRLSGGQTSPTSTPIPTQTGLAIGATAIQHAGSGIPHLALVASIIAGGAILFSALVLAGVLAFARGRRGGPRSPEGGTISIR
jgi:hypothetical protein